MKNNVIELKRYQSTAGFDYDAYNQRAKARFRNSEIRAWILYTVETAVTAMIGLCTVFCVLLAFTML